MNRRAGKDKKEMADETEQKSGNKPKVPLTMLSMTARAAKRIREIAAAEGHDVVLRISVSGGGCSGFSYGFALDEKTNDDDIVISRDGATIAVDLVSLDYMQGAEIDFVDDLIGQAFKIKNPLAQSSCGCGTSFSI
jgi:iron-sulfur cluster assembly accessory protein